MLALLALFFRLHNLPDVLVQGRFYFVDADCYSRMTRVEMISREPGRVIHHQSFENWPAGVSSHATAPMDYLIVGLERVVRWVWPKHGRFGGLAVESLDIAGALVSPLLGMLLVVVVGWWALTLRDAEGRGLAQWWMAPFLAAVSPAMVHATLLGRPDHQSLLVVLLGCAMVAEHFMICRPRRGFSVIGGVAWGMALWVSLFEPLVLLALVFGFGLIFARNRWWGRARGEWMGALLAVLLVAWSVEGVPQLLPNWGMRESLMRWGGTIGELHGAGLGEVFGSWMGAMVWGWPALLWIGRKRFAIEEKRGIWIFASMLCGLLGLAWWQIRWAPYVVLIFCFCLPWVLSFFRKQSFGALLGMLSLLPVATAWMDRIQPDPGFLEERHMDRSERVNARLAAERMRSPEVMPFLAVWWLSPSIAYWSGQPAVAGSGHEGISGILDSARFFVTENPQEAREILDRRLVRWVVASDPARAAENAREILGLETRRKPLAERLWEPNLELEWGLEGERNVTTFRLLKVLPWPSPEPPPPKDSE